MKRRSVRAVSETSRSQRASSRECPRTPCSFAKQRPSVYGTINFTGELRKVLCPRLAGSVSLLPRTASTKRWLRKGRRPLSGKPLGRALYPPMGSPTPFWFSAPWRQGALLCAAHSCTSKTHPRAPRRVGAKELGDAGMDGWPWAPELRPETLL